MRSFRDSAWILTGVLAGTAACTAITCLAEFSTADACSLAGPAVMLLLLGSLRDAGNVMTVGH